MDAVAERASPRSRSRSRHRSAVASSSLSSSPPTAPTYGYHNTFHTHAQLPLGCPPGYGRAVDPLCLRQLDRRAMAEQEAALAASAPPAYHCSIAFEGVVGVKRELASPFKLASHRAWQDLYAVLRGTQLSLHRLKTPSFLSKHRRPAPGRLLRSYSLQHAEAGVASDFRKTALTPKSPFAHMMPAASRAKLYESDPTLFEPVREHALRLRLELDQFLFCAASQEDMLAWVEAICAAIDISPPLEDRSEPRYRSLPRRSRRQRALDNAAHLTDNLESLSAMEAGRRIIAHQEQIIRQFYPHLAENTTAIATAATTTTVFGPASTTPAAAADLEGEDFDPEDVRPPTASPHGRSLEDGDANGHRFPTTSSSDPKAMPRAQPTASQLLKYRRRCAPVLLASSPRVSDVVFTLGKRLRISVKDHLLVDYTSHPPRYDAHDFPKSKRPPKIAITQVPLIISSSTTTAAAAAATTTGSGDPDGHSATPARAASSDGGLVDDSLFCLSYTEDMVPTRSESSTDDTGSSTPPTPTVLSHLKTGRAPELEALGKRRTSDEGREPAVSLRGRLLL